MQAMALPHGEDGARRRRRDCLQLLDETRTGPSGAGGDRAFVCGGEQRRLRVPLGCPRRVRHQPPPETILERLARVGAQPRLKQWRQRRKQLLYKIFFSVRVVRKKDTPYF